MSVCPQCGRERMPSRAAEENTCPECQGAAPLAPAPPAAGPSIAPGRRVPVSLVLVGINVLIYLAMVIKGASPTQPTADQLLRWGANFGPLTLSGQWWRLLTAMFVHIGIVHLAINMWCLWELGSMSEHLYGPRTLAWLYLLAGIAGSLASLIRNPLVVSAGASGAIFGLAGALIATLYFAKLPAPRREVRISLISLVVFTLFNVGYAMWTPPAWWPLHKGPVDNGAHIGGLISGLLLGSVLRLDFRRAGTQRRTVRSLAFPVFALLLVVGAVVVRQLQTPVVRLQRAEDALRKGDSTGALRQASLVVQARPNYAPAWLVIGTAYLRNRQDAEAESAFRRAAQLDAQNPAPFAQLGIMYLRSRRFEAARDMFQQITVITPKDPDAYVNLGVTLNLLGRNEEALASFRKAAALNPKLPLAWFNFGLASMNLKHYDDAVEAFTRTTKLAPKDAEAWIWLANAYQAKGMTQQADEAYLTGYRLKQTRRAAPRRQ